jgi:hypothetical protein
MPAGTEPSPSSEADPPASEEAKPTVLAEASTHPEPEQSVVNPQAAGVTAQPVEVGLGTTRRPSRLWQWAAAAGVVVLLAGGTGYLYFSGIIGKNPAKVQMKFDAVLKAQGLNDIFVEIGKDWVATVSGFVDNEADKRKALGIVKSDKDVKDVEDRITVATAEGSSVNAEPPSAEPPSMKKVEELIKQGAFE